jgi:hypothetical protein
MLYCLAFLSRMAESKYFFYHPYVLCSCMLQFYFLYQCFFLTTPHKSYILIIVCKLVNVREAEGGIKMSNPEKINFYEPFWELQYH